MCQKTLELYLFVARRSTRVTLIMIYDLINAMKMSPFLYHPLTFFLGSYVP
jgi:hypothetical protein